MTEKKNLMDFVHDIDLNGSYPEGSKEQEEEVAMGNAMEERSTTRHSRNLLLLFGVGAVLISSCLIVFHLRRLNSGDDFVKFRTSFRGNSGHLVDQEVISSEVNNIIEYYIRTSPDERLTIIDDFERDIQTVRISMISGDFCYVSELKKGAYVRPADLVFASQENKAQVSQVFETFGKQAGEGEMGDKASDLCRGIKVEWIRPVSETHSYISVENFTEASFLSHPGSRSKRNIRSCHVSCCYSVCCCDVKHFSWEMTEHFTCNHVCMGCTDQFKSTIKKIC